MLFSSARNTTLWWKKWPLRTGGEPFWIMLDLFILVACPVPWKCCQEIDRNRVLLSDRKTSSDITPKSMFDLYSFCIPVIASFLLGHIPFHPIVH